MGQGFTDTSDLQLQLVILRTGMDDDHHIYIIPLTHDGLTKEGRSQAEASASSFPSHLFNSSPPLLPS